MSRLIANKGRTKLIFSSSVIVTVLFLVNSYFAEAKQNTYVSSLDIQQWDLVPSEATLEEISKIENSIDFPDETYSMDSYFRYYAVGEYESEKILFAVFTHKSWGKEWGSNEYKSLAPSHENTFFVSDGYLPVVMDGGCGIIHITYNLAEPLEDGEKIIVSGPPDWRKVSRIYGECNGLA